MATRTLTAKSLTVCTDMTDAEAYEIVRVAVQENRVNAFVADLCVAFRKWGSGTTEARLAWLHKYAQAIVDREMQENYSAFDLNPRAGRAPSRRRYAN